MNIESTMLYVIIHVVGMFVWAAALSAQAITLFSLDARLVPIRKKIWQYGVLPGAIIGSIGAILLVHDLDGGLAANHWVFGKFAFLLFLILADILIQVRVARIATERPTDDQAAPRKFIRTVLILILIAIIGAVTVVAAHQADEDAQQAQVHSIKK